MLEISYTTPNSVEVPFLCLGLVKTFTPFICSIILFNLSRFVVPGCFVMGPVNPMNILRSSIIVPHCHNPNSFSYIWPQVPICCCCFVPHFVPIWQLQAVQLLSDYITLVRLVIHAGSDGAKKIHRKQWALETKQL